MSEIILSATHRTSKKNGRPMVFISTNKQDYWFTTAQWMNKGYDTNLAAFANGDLDVDFYAKGEALYNGDLCTDGGKIVKDFIAVQNVDVTARASAARAEMQERALLLSVNKFARNRTPVVAATAPAEVIAPVVVATAPVVEATADLTAAI